MITYAIRHQHKGKAHEEVERVGRTVVAACGWARIVRNSEDVERVPLADVPPDERCPRCWPGEVER